MDPGHAAEGWGWKESRREGPEGSSRVRGPVRGCGLGPAPRVPAAASARSPEAAEAAAAPAAFAAAPGYLGQGRPPDRLTEGAGGARPAGASHGRSFVWRGPCGGRRRPRELREAAPDPAAGRVLGEWPLSRCLIPPRPSPSPSSSPSPPSRAAGWGDITVLGAPTWSGGGAAGDSLGP